MEKPEKELTPEELSEVEEFLDMCMRVAPLGYTRDRVAVCNCPLNMAARAMEITNTEPATAAEQVAEILGLDFWQFIRAFDHGEKAHGSSSQMGQRFRQRAIDGEYAR